MKTTEETPNCTKKLLFFKLPVERTEISSNMAIYAQLGCITDNLRYEAQMHI
jgi:hypothetical protein